MRQGQIRQCGVKNSKENPKQDWNQNAALLYAAFQAKES